MKILLIGGPKFLGRHLITAALAAGHEITLFNRGNYSADNFPDVETIRGDRYRDLDKFAKWPRWNAVIDTCGYIPEYVKASAAALANAVDRYVFISSISAYADHSLINFDESAPLATLSEEREKRAHAVDLSGEITAYTLGDLYGGLKARCERAVEDAMPGRAIIIRPGLIVGAFDSTDRFTYWVTRVAKGGEVLAPGSPGRFVQFIDAGDLARWVIDMIERSETGVYNANGKPFDLTMKNLLTEIKDVSGSDASFIWGTDEFLAAENIRPWSEMPLYLPETQESPRGFLSVNIDKALQKGLKFRPLKETVQDTLGWARESLDEKKLKAGITAEREVALLDKHRKYRQ